jgi:hypothetical protein
MMNKIGGVSINDVDDDNQRLCSVLCAKFLDGIFPLYFFSNL